MKINDAKAIAQRLVGDANMAPITTRDISWYVPHYTPNIPQQTFLRKHIIQSPNSIIIH